MVFIKIPDHDYEMQDAPVTQGEWNEIMETDPSYFKGINNPVEQVSYEDIKKFLIKLNKKKDGYAYRLPYEQEWDLCAKSCDEQEIKDIAWCYENSKNKTHPIKQKLPNKLDLYDMLGNVWEWTCTQEGSNRVLCGGSWGNDAQYLRSGYRDSVSPGFRGNGGVGFRLVRTVSLDSFTVLPLDIERLVLAIAKVQAALDELKKIIK
jgi:formylglycine-generating enzyme required for sulfatase activity